eukprot:1152448-Pelagomonas_calceolata.AAC.4
MAKHWPCIHMQPFGAAPGSHSAMLLCSPLHCALLQDFCTCQHLALISLTCSRNAHHQPLTPKTTQRQMAAPTQLHSLLTLPFSAPLAAHGCIPLADSEALGRALQGKQ